MTHYLVTRLDVAIAYIVPVAEIVCGEIGSEETRRNANERSVLVLLLMTDFHREE